MQNHVQRNEPRRFPPAGETPKDFLLSMINPGYESPGRSTLRSSFFDPDLPVSTTRREDPVAPKAEQCENTSAPAAQRLSKPVPLASQERLRQAVQPRCKGLFAPGRRLPKLCNLR